MKNKTICVKCKHHIIENKSKIWYNQKCDGAPRKRYKDYTFGEEWDERPFCRDINDNGNCKYYKRK